MRRGGAVLYCSCVCIGSWRGHSCCSVAVTVLSGRCLCKLYIYHFELL